MSRSAKDIFLDALDIVDAAEREAFIVRESGGDTTLRDAVIALLSAHAGSPTFSPPAAGSSLLGPRTAGAKPPVEAGAGDIVDGQFTLIRRLGEGGFGVVWLARQTEPVTRDVALKLLRGSGIDSAQVVARFEAERQTLARMEHPHIARVYDAGATAAGVPYFAMEYVDGRPITAYCDEENLSLSARLDLVRQVCLAVQHAHQKGVIHRDLKPGNILVTTVDGKPVPKVIDFGIAKAVADDDDVAIQPSLTLEAQIIGTPQYMSPEQATIGPKNVDTRSDVYSLGTVLYELITGSPPFDPNELRRAGLEQICRIVRERTPSKPSTRLSEVSTDPASTTTTRTLDASRMRRQVAGEVDWIVMKALEKEPARRYQSAESLAADISRYLNHEPVDAGPPSALYAFRKFVRRRRLEVATAAIVALALVAVAAVSTYQKQQARRAEHAAEIARADAERAAAGEREAKEAAQKSEQLAVQRADDAARELSKANAIADFAETLLDGIGPGVAKGRDTGILKDMLGRAVTHTDERLDKLPEIDIAIRSMIGEAFRALGDYQRAIEVIRPRFDSMRDTPLRDNTERLGTGILLGALYKDTGQSELAAKTFREISDGYDRIGDYSTPNALQAKSALAKALEIEGKHGESIETYKKTLARIHELGKDESELAIEIRNAVAAGLLMDGKPDEARPEFEALLPLTRKLYGNEHPATIAAMTNLAQVYLANGLIDKAIELNTQVVDTVRKIYEPDHPLRVPGLNNLMAVLRDAKRYDEAEKYRAEVMGILEKNKGAMNWRTVVAFEQQALMLERNLAKFGEALSHAQRMRDAYFAVFGQYDKHTLAGEVYVLNALVDVERSEEAWKRVEAIGLDPWSADAERYLKMGWHGSLAEILFTLGRLDEARHEMELGKSLAETTPSGLLEVSPRLARVIKSFVEHDAAATRPSTQPSTAPATRP